MIIQTEPMDLLMVRYKLYFNQQCPDPEDPWVLAYLHEHGLEPRRQLDEAHDGISYKVFHFGQCYLGRHVANIGELYQRGVEHSALAQHLAHLLSTAEDETIRTAAAQLDATAMQTVATEMAAQLYDSARFEVTPERDLHVDIDPTAVLQAFRSRQSLPAT
jgi:hypothetical protein